MSKEPEFKWDDSLIKDFLSENFFSYALNQTLEERLKKFKESKQPKPEWEIIQVSSPECGLYYLDGYKMRPNDKIYSIKRLSDNSIWTLDDKFIANAGCELTIKRFDVTDVGMQVWSNEFGFWFLEEIKKPRLFTTEDGVGVSIGDEFTYVTKDFKLFHDRCDSYSGGKVVAHSRVGDKFFSTPNKAEEYILMNKPLFSISEILSNIVNHSVYKDNYKDLIINLAKEKLNKP